MAETVFALLPHSMAPQVRPSTKTRPRARKKAALWYFQICSMSDLIVFSKTSIALSITDIWSQPLGTGTLSPLRYLRSLHQS